MSVLFGSLMITSSNEINLHIFDDEMCLTRGRINTLALYWHLTRHTLHDLQIKIHLKVIESLKEQLNIQSNNLNRLHGTYGGRVAWVYVDFYQCL